MHKQLSRQIEYLDIVKCRIGNVYVPLGIDGNTTRPGKRSGSIPNLPDRPDQPPRRILYLYVKEQGIDHEELVTRSQGNLNRSLKPAIKSKAAADTA